MASLNPVTAYQQVLSMALEDRRTVWQDLVSNNNATFLTLKRKGLWQTYSGPRIRQTLQFQKSDAQWYNGYDFLDNPPIELFNDCYFMPKMVAVPISMPMEEILNNQGKSQLIDSLSSYMQAAEEALMDAMDTGLQSDGTANGGKQLGGLGLAVPILDDQGTYGGISRVSNAIWRTTTYSAATDFPGIGTTVTSTTIRPMLNRIMTQRSRGRRYPDLLLMSAEHYEAYDAATTSIQRITREGSLASLGFPSLEYIGGGKRAEIVLDGGIGSNMPANTTIGLETGSLRLRYNESRNFDPLFEGDGQKPINQDALAQYIGWMGEFTMTNPLFQFRFVDSI